MNGYLGSQTSGNDWPEPVPVMVYQDFQESGALPSPKRRAQILADFEDEMVHFENEHNVIINDVRRNFVLPTNSSVEGFFNDHRTIPQLLLQAVPHVKRYFGADVVFNLRVPIDESGSQTLYAVAMWPGTLKDVRRALEQFDDAWWIANSRKASGYLTFTYELV